MFQEEGTEDWPLACHSIAICILNNFNKLLKKANKYKKSFLFML